MEAGTALVALNEIRFRETNEAIARDRDVGQGLVPFVCECGQPACCAVIELTPGEYEEVRAGSRCFIVAPRHEGGLEVVIYEASRYSIVRKVDELAAELADATDPRRQWA
jgi:hypothetical protein